MPTVAVRRVEVSPVHAMHVDTSRAWKATHLIRTAEPTSREVEVQVMLCADEDGDGPAYTREEWELARGLPQLPPPVWTRRRGEWLALGTGPKRVDGRSLFWAEPVDSEDSR